MYKKPTKYQECLKSNKTVHAARTTFIAEKKSITFYNITMSHGFENQISAVSLHLAEKHFPENHLPEKHFPELSFSRINICQKSHLPE